MTSSNRIREGEGLRTLLGTQTYPSLPAASQNALNLRDDQGRERTRLTVVADGTPSLEFLDATGNVTHVIRRTDGIWGNSAKAPSCLEWMPTLQVMAQRATSGAPSA